MKLIGGQKWQIPDPQVADRVRAWLLERGGTAEPPRGTHEHWRIRLAGGVWSYYRTGTLYVTASDDPALLELQREVSRQVGGRFVPASRLWLVGCDEAGKGELLGPVMVAAVWLRREQFTALEELIGVADTKASHAPSYWAQLAERLRQGRGDGFDWELGLIPPRDVDRYHLNRLLDWAYYRVLLRAGCWVDLRQARIVLDDYRADAELVAWLDRLAAEGAEVFRQPQADERFLECRLAALVAKAAQQRVLEALATEPAYRLPGYSLGSGNAGDPRTRQWLEGWVKQWRSLPWFVKRSFRTVAAITSVAATRKGAAQPVNLRLVAEPFLAAYRCGQMDLTALAIVCPHCGRTERRVRLERRDRHTAAVSVCCAQPIEGLEETLRYLCGRLWVSGDGELAWLVEELERPAPFFEGYTVVLETSGGKRDPRRDRLQRQARQGRILLEEIGRNRRSSDAEGPDRPQRCGAMPLRCQGARPAVDDLFSLEIACPPPKE